MLVIADRYDRDPFESDHDDDCTGESCRDGNELVDKDELQESGYLNCKGCAFEYTLLSIFIEHDLELGLYDRVMAGFNVAALVERFQFRIDQIDAASVHDMLVVTAEQARYEVQQMLNAKSKNEG